MKNNLFIILLLSALPVAGQVSFTTTINKNKATVNDRLTLSFTLTNCNGKNFKAPTLADFYVIGGPNQSSQFSNYNGKMSQSISYNYVIQPKNPGIFTIGAASVDCNGDELKSQTITIEVTDAPASQSNSSPGQNNSSSQTTDLTKYAKENFFIRVEISDGEIYKGEQVIVTYKIYEASRSAILKWAPTANPQIPKFDGFYTEDITPQNQLPKTEILNGINFTSQILKQYKLTSQTAGDITIEPLSLPVAFAIQVKAQKKSNNIWDDFFNDPFSTSYEQVRLSVNSPSVKLKVNTLPPNSPSDFNGAVGNFSMQTEINATETITDEPLTYKVKISGNGNLDLFVAPKLSLPPGWETYEPEIENNGSSKTFSYFLIPRSPGEFSIPAHTWSYFSPEQKQYITLSSEAYNVTVEAAPGYTASQVSGVNKEEVQMLAQDIRFINRNEPVFHKTETSVNKPLFYSAIGLPFMLGIFLFIYAGKKNKLDEDIIGKKTRMATPVAKKRLKKAAVLAKENNSKGFYNETIKALWGYLSDKFNIPQSELSKENIEGILLQKRVSEGTIADMLQILNSCELALFAPQLASSSLEETYQMAIHTITKLEAEIKG
ncbi:MAG: BatD family protein [Chitinophagales bacterium]